MRTVKPLTTALLGFALFLSAPDGATAQSRPVEGAQQIAALGGLQLRSGEQISDFRIGYRTIGRLDSAKSNAILWCTPLGGRSEDLLQYMGPHNVVDTSRYFVVMVDAIGNGISSSPSNSQTQPLTRFPQFAIRDMVEAEHRLLTEVLHIPHLHAVAGVSMGGMQAFEWAVSYPDFVDLAIPMMGSPQSTAADKLLWTAAIGAIQLDPAWHNGHPSGTFGPGLELAGEIETMNMTSPAYRVAHVDPATFSTYLEGIHKRQKGDAGAACDHIRQRQAILGFDIPGEYGVTLEQAAKRAHVKMLIVVSPQDHTVSPQPAIQFAAAMGAPVITLDSPCGHVSLACISAGPIVAQFLADPDSILSQTLHDPAAVH
jgi:homoserine O-acetyltransferase